LERFALEEVRDLQSIKGIEFPAGVSFRQLVVTGPPGVGKTTLISAIGGWPEEGFLDLTSPNWWRSRVLAMRPRQLHLGLPFEGHRRGVTVFDDDFLEASEPLVLELDRIALPPLSGRREPWKLRRKYVFEFLLPPAREVYEARRRRSDRQSHLVDEAVDLARVRSQLDASWRVAQHLYHAGIPVFVRDAFGGRPKTFADPTSREVVEAKLRGEASEARQSFLRSAVKRMLAPSGYRVLDRFERVELRGRRALVPWRVLPVELTLGARRFQLHADGHEVRVFDPERYFVEPAVFGRLAAGDTLRLSPSGEGLDLGDGPPEGPSRVEIAHEGDWLSVADLDSVSGTRLQAIHGADARRLETDRSERFERLRTLLDGMPPHLHPERAAADLERAIELLEKGTWRPRDAEGRPGGLVEIPDEVIPVVVGDLHGQVDNLVTILIEGRTLDGLESGRVAVVLLGDVVHPQEGDLTDMASSLLITDLVVRLMISFPGRVVHLRGNHETFSSELTKSGIAQGRAWKQWVTRERGTEGVQRLRRFYELLPFVAVGRGFIACHAGPPTGTVSRKRLIQLRSHPRLAQQITWGRVRSPRRPGGYAKRDVRALQKALGHDKPSITLVSHDPGPDREVVVLNRGGIKRHHLVYSARPDRVGVFTRHGPTLAPLVYPARRDFHSLSGTGVAGAGRPMTES
jgi:hypothetical protein